MFKVLIGLDDVLHQFVSYNVLLGKEHKTYSFNTLQNLLGLDKARNLAGGQINLRDISGKKNIKETHGPAKQGEQYRSALDYQLARKALGWEPEVRLKDGLKMTYDWFKDNN